MTLNVEKKNTSEKVNEIMPIMNASIHGLRLRWKNICATTMVYEHNIWGEKRERKRKRKMNITMLTTKIRCKSERRCACIQLFV